MLYPFTAIVGQDEMKLALLLNAINPSVGGVLIEGGKGHCQIYGCPCFGEPITPYGDRGYGHDRCGTSY